MCMDMDEQKRRNDDYFNASISVLTGILGGLATLILTNKDKTFISLGVLVITSFIVVMLITHRRSQPSVKELVVYVVLLIGGLVLFVCMGFFQTKQDLNSNEICISADSATITQIKLKSPNEYKINLSKE